MLEHPLSTGRGIIPHNDVMVEIFGALESNITITYRGEKRF